MIKQMKNFQGGSLKIDSRIVEVLYVQSKLLLIWFIYGLCLEQ